ncbi:glucosamine-phosphate N-acetyltransferase [Marchantia polymorpha subsp. ruderalis]|uniref:Glucosamine 6-phosphate N-acetyltransferase n=2 Tax=Marchantia polymorpha TaxID=3197 RepID=A0A176VFA4_MARPO|nr:hypothetical protein AXG93_2062s1340 [Marchantia polymorpha subsp. ruderalis]PTQ39195.1 hypothetical protein MARPO_0046s0019 [Marchantia polymorpha]BBN15811.1 hypothetical protein Mp_7g01050 [Marchantia polymorpha subsp. ruderalis]|eukprot:PTQ39195.1 hypothetical protein MARPO_0046s0019 [Marchantia polymorpha]
MSDDENLSEEEEAEEEEEYDGEVEQVDDEDDDEDEDLELGACLGLLSLKISEEEVEEEDTTMELGDLPHPFVVRDLEPSDFRKGHLKLLEQLTKVGDVSEEAFTKRVEEMRKLGDFHHVVVIEDVEKQAIVATATLLVELKLARNCGKVGHIEDVVVDQTVRGQRLGQRVVCHLAGLAEQLGCYKVILDCTEANAPFYEKCGFKPKELQMAQYF